MRMIHRQLLLLFAQHITKTLSPRNGFLRSQTPRGAWIWREVFRQDRTNGAVSVRRLILCPKGKGGSYAERPQGRIPS